MENFNIKRFGQALKCHFLVSRKSWIRIFGIYTLILFFANLFFTRVEGMSDGGILSRRRIDFPIFYCCEKLNTFLHDILLYCHALWCQLSVFADEGYTQALCLFALACVEL